ncbi:MAG: hypothetical protein LQ345_004543 [Seirophora villosa]|nr:MAG: hypothetical protein LQ345_004543 [Seirophora villosa]
MSTPQTLKPQAPKHPLGFLDLPPEIRIQIYPYILSTSHLQPSIPPQQLPPSSQHHHPPPRHTLRITYTGNPAQFHHQPPRYYGCTDEAIYPAILATCRQIRLEASPFLYGAPHTFSFTQDYCGGTVSKVEDVRSQVMYSSAAVKLRWQWPKDNAQKWANAAPQPSPLLAFIQKIGIRNAAQVANLELYSSAAGDDVALAAELCGAHMPGLRTLRVCVAGFHFRGSLEPVYAALAGFVEKVRWLEELRVEYVRGKLDVGKGR